MAGDKRRGFIGWLSGALRGAPETPLASEESEKPDISSGNEEAGVPKRRSDPIDDLFGGEESTFVPPPRPSLAVETAETTATAPRPRATIRPPGAVADFEEACTRCGLCIEACPVDAIFVGVADGLPTLLPHRTPCELCAHVPCAAACPDSALLPISRAAIHVGTVEVLTRLCLNSWREESCDRCFDQCPIPGTLTPGLAGIPQVDADLCVGCGLCAKSCPAEPQAMVVRPSPNPHHLRPPESSKA